MKGTLKSKEDFDLLFSKGRTLRTQHVMAKYITIDKTPDRRRVPSGRVAFVAAKRIGTAVQRNRGKRVLRASLQRLGGCPQGLLLVLMVRNLETLTLSPKKLDEECSYLLNRAKQ